MTKPIREQVRDWMLENIRSYVVNNKCESHVMAHDCILFFGLSMDHSQWVYVLAEELSEGYRIH